MAASPLPTPPATVRFVPFWTENPYQSLLAGGLRQQGCTVTGRGFEIPPTGTGEAPECVHLHWIPPFTLWPRRLARLVRYLRALRQQHRAGVPIVWTAHNLLPHESVFTAIDGRIARWIAAQASGIICHSESARSEVLARWRVQQPGKVCVIPHGNYLGVYANTRSPAECRGELGIPPDATVFLALGQIRRYKGVSELVTAFRQLPDAKARLLIAGKPQSPAIDEDLRARITGDERILYRPGHVADADMQLYFNASDVVVLPYLKSLTSGALVLAMSFGRACIAPDLETMAECLTREGGFLYDPRDANALGRALQTALERRRELTGMGVRNLARARQWGWDEVAKATAACYARARHDTASRR